MNKYYSDWQDNEPNNEVFNYDERNYSPITKIAFESCGSNPNIGCSISGSQTISSIVHAASVINSDLFDDSLCEAQCPNEKATAKASKIWKQEKLKILEPTTLRDAQQKTAAFHTSRDKVTEKTPMTPFVDLAVILEITVDSVHECMAVYGPDLVDVDTGGNYVGTDPCVNYFSTTQAASPGYSKWVDMDCNQRTRSVICAMYGKIEYFKTPRGNINFLIH